MICFYDCMSKNEFNFIHYFIIAIFEVRSAQEKEKILGILYNKISNCGI